jgi:ribose 1,5-bisphosphokinase PhnN
MVGRYIGVRFSNARQLCTKPMLTGDNNNLFNPVGMPAERPLLVFLTGATNSGKTTLMDAARTDRSFGLVEVGRTMRAKYMDPASPFYKPDYFSGEAAPKHTETEAYGMMLQGISSAWGSECDIVLIDGQPRSPGQCTRILRDFAWWPKVFVNLHAPEDVRRARAEKRDHKNPEALKLALTRVSGDMEAVNEVNQMLVNAGQSLLMFGTYPDDMGRPGRILTILCCIKDMSGV